MSRGFEFTRANCVSMNLIIIFAQVIPPQLSKRIKSGKFLIYQQNDLARNFRPNFGPLL